MNTAAPRRLLCGWGRTSPTAATIVRPGSGPEVEELVAATGARAGTGDAVADLGRHVGGSAAGHGLVARGLGRSYGDAAQCAGGTVVDCTGFAAVLDLDPGTGTVRAEGGASFDALLRVLVPRGFFVPVTPGTRFVTLGGAIASDIHGKNHHADGSIGAHVGELRLATPGGPLTCGPAQDPEAFFATCGGMGLTGVVSEAALRLLPIETSSIVVDTDRAADLDSCLALLAGEGDRYRYSVAWVDSLSRGRRLGRAVLTRGNHAGLDELPARARRRPLAYGASQRLRVPFAPPFSLLNSQSVAAFNEMWFRKAPRQRRGELQSIPGFFHPLDGIGGWNLLYGPRGFTQYQLVVPFGAEGVLRTVLERLSAARVPSFLTVLKRFGAQGSGYLSFPSPGWTLALDLPVGAGLGELLDGFDAVVAEAGGRVYLSKDGRLRPGVFAAMYPRFPEWAAVRERLDPNGVMSSDLGRRLGLVRRRSGLAGPPLGTAAALAGHGLAS